MLMRINQPKHAEEIVSELYANCDLHFSKILFQDNSFQFQNLPTQVDIQKAFTQIEKHDSEKKQSWSDGQEDLLSLVVFGTCLKRRILPINLVLQAYYLQQVSDWEQISLVFQNHSWKACRSRWLQKKKIRAPWTQEEDKALAQLYEKYPNKWGNIALELFRICQTNHIRLGKQCRDRWINKLDPNIVKSPWRKEEELKLFNEVEKRGKKWSTISLKAFQLSRTENQLKNRFYNLLKQQENKMQLWQMKPIEREKILIKQIIEQLGKEIQNNPTNRKYEETYFEQDPANIMKIKIFTSYCRKNPLLVMIKGNKMIKLNEDD